MTYTANLGTSVAGLWDDFHQVWKMLGSIFVSDAFNPVDGSFSAISTTPMRVGFYTGTVSDGVVAYFLGSVLVPTNTSHKPSTYTATGTTFFSGPGNAYDGDLSTYDDMKTTANINSTGWVQYSGFSGSATGTLRIKMALTGALGVNFDGVEYGATASVEYTFNGTDWFFAASVDAYSSTGVITFESGSYSGSLANVAVRVLTQTTRMANPTGIIKSEAVIYDIDFYGS